MFMEISQQNPTMLPTHATLNLPPQTVAATYSFIPIP